MESSVSLIAYKKKGHRTNFPKIKFNLLPCVPALPVYSLHARRHTHTHTNLNGVGTLKKQKGPSVFWNGGPKDP